MKCYSYIRVSGNSQITGDGFPRQRAAVDAWATLNGATIEEEFREEGVTGEAEWKDRPAFEGMIARILDNGVRTIVVENLGRLARAYVIQDQILTFLASREITLFAADTGENVTEAFQADPMRRAMIQMQAVFMELEKNSLVRKLRAARQRKKAATGRCEGRIPYGVKPGEAETLVRMRKLRGQRKVFLTYDRVAKALNDEGRRNRSGGLWKGEAVRKILMRH